MFVATRSRKTGDNIDLYLNDVVVILLLTTALHQITTSGYVVCCTKDEKLKEMSREKNKEASPPCFFMMCYILWRRKTNIAQIAVLVGVSILVQLVTLMMLFPDRLYFTARARIGPVVYPLAGLSVTTRRSPSQGAFVVKLICI